MLSAPLTELKFTKCMEAMQSLFTRSHRFTETENKLPISPETEFQSHTVSPGNPYRYHPRMLHPNYSWATPHNQTQTQTHKHTPFSLSPTIMKLQGTINIIKQLHTVHH
jgi:hypothetical protein